MRASTLLAWGVMTLALCAARPSAEPLTSIPNPRVRDGTWVTDMPGALRADTVAQLNAVITDFERTTGAEMAVVVIASLDGLSIEDAAEKLFQLWGIGKKGSENGLLFLWSTGDRRVRVEVGYGLEGVLPDGKAGAILDTYVIPNFKAGQFDAGVLGGVNALLKAARNQAVALPAAGSESYESDGIGIADIWFGVMGSFAAAIASTFGFRRWRRYRRRRCPQCQTYMTRLNEADDDTLLNEGQVTEERIGSVDYDGWKCPACSHHFTVRYPKWLSTYDKCPQCANRTKSANETVLKAATTSSSGTANVVETCAFCNFRNEFTKVIPRVQQSSSSSSSRSGSSSGSSFGGGRSGGGGASRGY
jgi:uncharacterized protein